MFVALEKNYNKKLLNRVTPNIRNCNKSELQTHPHYSQAFQIGK